MKELYTNNYSEVKNKQNEYIIIHYTGNPNTTAENNARYFATTNNKVSAHYVVDENEVYKCLPDNVAGWHVGGKPEDPLYHPYYKKATNNNSIGIEICCKGDLAGLYYNPDAIKNAVKLTVYLMVKYHIPITKVITHCDVTGKICPRNFDFVNFKKEVRKMLENLENLENLKNDIDLIKNDIQYLKNQLEKSNKKIIHYWSEITDDEQYIILRNLYDKGIIKGRSPQDLDISEDNIRMLVYNARAGLYNDLQ